MSDTLLIIEDEAALATELARHFTASGWDVETAASLAQAREGLLERRLESLVTLADMSLPDGYALDLLEETRRQKLAREWILRERRVSSWSGASALRKL